MTNALQNSPWVFFLAVFLRQSILLQLFSMVQIKKAFSSFSADDLEKEKDFYKNKLGIPVTKNDMGILEMNISGNQVIIYPKPNHEPANFTVLNFPVDNIEQAVDELTAKGVAFEKYDMPNIKTTEKGIADGGGGPRIAWFKDPAGNILSVLQERWTSL